ncbi:hypothetical protein ACSIGC_08175 [Tenacibaculum sp. ZS6-P6]|uniref:hypothetical protein n=1 Tax=Tenacibaculum sp. ZS6-P6 TaxID=3447503 RepID=UPI003F968BD2
MARDLRLRVAATKIPPHRFLKDRTDILEGLDDDLFTALIKGEYDGLVDPSHINYLYAACKAEKKTHTRRQSKEKTEIPSAKRDKIKDEIKRTGLTISRLLKIHPEVDINPVNVRLVVNNKINKWFEKEIDIILSLYAQRPDRIVNEETILQTDKDCKKGKSQASLKSTYIPVTEDMVQHIKLEASRTGISPRTLSTASNYDGNFQFIYKLYCGHQKSIAKDKLDTIYKLYAQLPDKSGNLKRGCRNGYTQITPDIIEEIEHHIERTGLGIYRFMNLYGLNYIGISNVTNWVKGRAKSALKEHVETLLNTWKTLPDNYYIKIIPEMSAHVKNEIERTGIGVHKILRGNTEAKKAGITSSQIKSVIECTSLKMKATMVHQILALWNDKPNKS